MVSRSFKIFNTYYGQLSFLEIKPNENFEIPKEMELNKKYIQKSFLFKKLVKIIYLLDELNKDKYTKFILRHLANDNIENGSEILAAELATNIDRDLILQFK